MEGGASALEVAVTVPPYYGSTTRAGGRAGGRAGSALEVTVRVPPCASASSLAMLRPRPVPAAFEQARTLLINTGRFISDDVYHPP
jgi:hypothetical protein